jgi:hypothetical protein
LQYQVPRAINLDGMLLTKGMSKEKAWNFLYDFEEHDMEIDFLTRVVVFTFHPSNTSLPMTLGKVNPTIINFNE